MSKMLYESTVTIEDTKNSSWRISTKEANSWIQATGNLILLNGVPSENGVMIGYIQKPTAMSADADEPDPRIQEYFHQYLKYAAAAWLLSQASSAEDSQKASEFYAKFTVGLGLGPMPLANKDVKR